MGTWRNVLITNLLLVIHLSSCPKHAHTHTHTDTKAQILTLTQTLTRSQTHKLQTSLSFRQASKHMSLIYEHSHRCVISLEAALSHYPHRTRAPHFSQRPKGVWYPHIKAFRAKTKTCSRYTADVILNN